ncbi:BON domain-containing protein [Exilibacterium tricleocarpae]|uniref:Osmotically-inducible protein Y n=1 Tax=Exilibacterium tricleocarpae TaxID=2591008 RepID=A0A545T1S6_9GAMM|nr:BON domain-containing protein [Exilibacterium tricleocarpae]TQV71155.1 BON domain-containing protein [Exilibacterium tricleocarpae]
MVTTVRKTTALLLSLILVGLLAACAGSATQESTGEYLDDSVITTKVKTSLLKSPDVSGFAIEVETFKGDVQLSGFVDTAAQRARAETLAREVAGVADVENNIIVK